MYISYRLIIIRPLPCFLTFALTSSFAFDNTGCVGFQMFGLIVLNISQ